MTTSDTITGLRTQMHLLRVSKLADCCELLVAHLTELAVTPSHFDEDAFAAILTARAVLRDATESLDALGCPSPLPTASASTTSPHAA